MSARETTGPRDFATVPAAAARKREKRDETFRSKLRSVLRPTTTLFHTITSRILAYEVFVRAFETAIERLRLGDTRRARFTK